MEGQTNFNTCRVSELNINAYLKYKVERCLSVRLKIKISVTTEPIGLDYPPPYKKSKIREILWTTPLEARGEAASV